jgi:hypothetical protein
MIKTNNGLACVIIVKKIRHATMAFFTYKHHKFDRYFNASGWI